LLTFSKSTTPSALDDLLLLDELDTLAEEIESLLDDRLEEELRKEAMLRLLEELRVLAELRELLQLAELRDEYTEEAVVPSVRAESREHTSLQLSFVAADSVVASETASSSSFGLRFGTDV
jgi:hypothetical protein